MEKPKLDLNDLEVSSFDTSAQAISQPSTVLGPSIINPNDPTAATWCYICPVRTENCY
jgi:hypothetical protein